MVDLRQLTYAYVQAFHNKDLEAIAVLLADDFTLNDPAVTALCPKTAVLEFTGELFASHESLEFEAHTILVDGAHSVVHFVLELDSKVFDGVDLISWGEDKM